MILRTYIKNTGKIGADANELHKNNVLLARLHHNQSSLSGGGSVVVTSVEDEATSSRAVTTAVRAKASTIA